MLKVSVLAVMTYLYGYFLVLSLSIITVLAADKIFNLNQNDYEIKFEWGKAVRYNKEFLKEFNLVVFKYNRTCTAGNLTTLYNIEVGNELEMVVQAYKFLSNEYREFPLRLQVNFCVAIKNNLVGGNQITSIGNFKGCPIRKGVRYVSNNFVPDPSKFPPFIPNGRYKLEIQSLYRDTEVSLVEVYGEVYRPFVEFKRKH